MDWPIDWLIIGWGPIVISGLGLSGVTVSLGPWSMAKGTALQLGIGHTLRSKRSEKFYS